ncbi:hypothetical protein VTN00DRAFT_806 [Thermoascus crustaceus]|uniref:uncharacterized protein n=1 Tax=Thermoascus crustaceus TaxID=5088 RepID=UPI003743417D
MPVMATRTKLSMVQHAIVPTKPGQIGVNPVDIPNLSYANIQYHSLFSDYIDVAVVTNADGDVDVLMTPELVRKFKDLTNAAKSACPKLTARQSNACGLQNFVEDVLRQGGVIQEADAALPEGCILTGANDIGEALQELIRAMRAGGAVIPPKLAAGAGAGALAIVFYNLMEDAAANHQDVPDAFVIPSSVVNPSHTSTTSATGCPKGAPTSINAPVCDDDDLKKDILENQQTILANLVDDTTPPGPSASCLPNDNPLKDASGIDTSFVQKLAVSFCKVLDPTRKDSADLTNKDLARQSNAYEGYTFHFDYSPGKGECEMDCAAAYKALVTKCMGLDSHSMQPEGHMKIECGAEYTYKTTPPKTSPSTATETSPEDTDKPDQNGLSNKACQADKAPYSPTFRRSTGIDAINELCKQKFEAKTGAPCIQTTQEERGDTLIFAKVALVACEDDYIPCSLVDFTCGGSDFEETCKQALQSAMDDCDTNTVDAKKGGSNERDCIAFTIFAYDKKDGIPKDQQCP